MTTPFLTALAPEARAAGSRDPLGLLPLWARIGRRGIGNVTTVSGDLRGWTQLLIAVGMTRTWGDTDSQVALTRSFLAAERVIVFALTTPDVAPDTPHSTSAVRGVTRARMLLREARSTGSSIPVGDLRESAILGNQRAAGVWGQISASAHASRLLDRKAVQLVGDGERLWHELYEPTLRAAATDATWTRLLSPAGTFEPWGRDLGVVQALIRLHRPELTPAESDVYRSTILEGRLVPGGPTIQPQLVEQWLERGGLEQPLDRTGIATFAEQQRELGHVPLADWLSEVHHAEDLLAPAEAIFQFVLHMSRARAPLGEIAGAVAQKWSIPPPRLGEVPLDLLREVGRDTYGTTAHHDLLVRLLAALASSDHVQAVTIVLDLNEWVMRRRGGGGWVQRSDTGLRALLGDGADLPTGGVVGNQLVHSYYLDPLRRLVATWEEGSRGIA